MSTPDVNYRPLEFYDIHGTPDKWIEVTVDATRSDKWIVAGHPDPTRNGTFDAPNGNTDTLKVSLCSFIVFTITGTLVGGAEDCFDCNNLSHHIIVYGGNLASGGKFISTIKGGSHDIELHGTIIKHGSEVDIDLGNHSDQSSAKTTNVSLYLSAADQFTIRVLNADRPMVAGLPSYLYLFPSPYAWYHGFCVWFFETFRKIFWK